MDIRINRFITMELKQKGVYSKMCCLIWHFVHVQSKSEMPERVSFLLWTDPPIVLLMSEAHSV